MRKRSLRLMAVLMLLATALSVGWVAPGAGGAPLALEAAGETTTHLDAAPETSSASAPRPSANPTPTVPAPRDRGRGVERLAPAGAGPALPRPEPSPVPGLTKPTTERATVEPGQRIYGGQTASAGQFPWAVAVSIRDSAGTILCGGALIAPQWVITAAHCVYDDSGKLYPASAYTLRIGAIDRTNSADGETKTVNLVVPHPFYIPDPDTTDGYYDIALLQLTSRSAIPPLKLLQPSDFSTLAAPGTPATIMGWGRTASDASTSRVLRYAEVPIRADSACLNVPSYSELPLVYSIYVNLCVGPDPKDESFCAGDSGGPIVVRNAAKTEWLLVALVSWSVGPKTGACSGGSPQVGAWVTAMLNVVSNVTGAGVTVIGPYVSDSNNIMKTLVNPGDLVVFGWFIVNSTGARATVTRHAVVTGPRTLLEVTGSREYDVGLSGWYFESTIPRDAPPGVYTFTVEITYAGVTTRDSWRFEVRGTSAPTPTPPPVTGVVQGNLQFIRPTRVLDTRPTSPADGITTTGFTPAGNTINPGPLAAGETRRYLLGSATFGDTAFSGDTTGVLANVTVVPISVSSSTPPGSRYVTVFAGDVAQPPSALTVPLNTGVPISFNFAAFSLPTSGSAAGTFNVFSTDPAHVIVDVVGHYSPRNPTTTGAFRFVPPTRVLDTRPTSPADGITTIGFNADGSPIGPGALTPDATRRFKLAGQTFGSVSVPTDATGVLLHVTNVQNQGSGGFVTVFPGGATRPTASTLNPVTPIAFNSLLVGLGTGADAGTLAVFSKTASHVVIDLLGYYAPSNPPSGSLTLVTPTRIVSTRADLGGPIGFAPGGSPIALGPLRPQTTTRYLVGGQRFGGLAVPGDITGILASVTIAGDPAGGFVTLLPGSAPAGRPNVSTVNPVTPAAASFWANAVPADGTIAVYLESGGEPRDIAIDLLGYLR